MTKLYFKLINIINEISNILFYRKQRVFFVVRKEWKENTDVKVSKMQQHMMVLKKHSFVLSGIIILFAAVLCGNDVKAQNQQVTLTNKYVKKPCAITTSGTISIGASKSYPSITAALVCLQSSGITGPIIMELESDYVSSTETFPINFQAIPGISATNTITIRPGVAPITISGVNASATFNFDGAKYITIDGRTGGTGTTSNLTIINTNTSGVAIEFINDAQHNKITYCDIQGQNSSASATILSGVIYFATASVDSLKGNDFDTISYSNIHATAGGFPTIGISSYGSTSTTGSWNDYDVIDHCNIYDFFSASLSSTAIKCDGGSNAYTISNNHIYQTAARTYTTNNVHRGFWLTPTGFGTFGTCGFQVLNNFIGGNSSIGSGTYSMLGSAANSFWAMDINHQGTIHTSVQGNTITNISMTSSNGLTADLFRGICTGNTGNMDLGNVAPNIIGSATTTGAINLITTGTGSSSFGIKVLNTILSTDSINVNNNIIGGITVSSSTTTNANNLYGIGVTSVSYIQIAGNTIINLISSDTATGNIQSVAGISVLASTVDSISGNTITNINNGYAGSSSGFTNGITVTGSNTNTYINNNVVKNISSASTSVGSGSASALIGILMNTNSPATVSENTIDSLVLTSSSTTAATVVEGLVFGSNGTTPTNLITKNFVHSLFVNAANPSAIIKGVDITGGSNILANNMVRLGITPSGTSISTGESIYGIVYNTSSTQNIYFNSVYIGGTGVGTNTNNTYAFYRINASGTFDIKNNIFANNRSNGSTGGSHYVFGFTSATNGATINYNVYQNSGTGAIFANNGVSNIANYSSVWVTGDVNSYLGDPKFKNPTGTLSTVDLHIQSSSATPIEGAGIAVAAITDDYDGQFRGSLTPTDIGADAGNFVSTLQPCTSITLNAGTAVASMPIFGCPPTITLTLTGGNFKTVYGLNYQWQSRPTGTSTYTNIVGATLPSYTVNFLVASDFQCVITCSGGSTATSGYVTVNLPSPGTASGFSPLALTGFNVDVIANDNSGSTPFNTTTFPIDATNGYTFYDASYKYNNLGPTGNAAGSSLPINGQVVSVSVTGLLYQLQAASNGNNYTGPHSNDNNNALQLRGGGGAGTTLTGTLTLSTPQSGTAVYLLATTGSLGGTPTISAVVNFTDGTSQTFTSLTVFDWFNGTPYSQGGFGRASSSGFDVGTLCVPSKNPRMYDITLALSPSNYTKLVKSITITNTSTITPSALINIINVFAATMAVATPAAFCGGLATSVTLFNPPTTSGVTYQWMYSNDGTSYSNVTNGTGATTTTYTNTNNGIVYYECQATCPGGGFSALSNPVLVSINPKVTPSVTISANPSGIILPGTPVTFTTTTVNGGISPIYQWYYNGSPVVGANFNTYTNSNLNNNDSIRCTIISNAACVVNLNASSNSIIINISSLPSISVNGNFLSPLKKLIPNASIDISGTTNYISNSTGNYSVSLSNGGKYTLRATKNNDVLKANGVSAIDIAYIQNHILQKSILNSPYKLIAADVNGDGKVSVLDISFIKRLILKLDTTFTNAITGEKRLWAFVDSSYNFPIPTKPFPYKDSISFTNLTTTQLNQTFTGMKLGDVNWDWNPAKAREDIENIENDVEFYYSPFDTKNIYSSEDDRQLSGEVRIPIRVKNFKELVGIQFTFGFDTSMLTFKGIANNKLKIENGTNYADQGNISFLWVDPMNEIITLEDGSVLLELVFMIRQANHDIKLSLNGDVTSVAAYDKDYGLHGIVLKIENFQPALPVAKEFFTIAPNPITDGVFHIQMNLKEKKLILLRLLDHTGKVILVKEVEGMQGANNITLKQSGKLAVGVYYLQVMGLDGEGIKKVVVN